MVRACVRVRALAPVGVAAADVVAEELGGHVDEGPGGAQGLLPGPHLAAQPKVDELHVPVAVQHDVLHLPKVVVVVVVGVVVVVKMVVGREPRFRAKT